MARILVAGTGALGSVFGGFLRLAGHAVTLLGRAPHIDAIAAGGLSIDGIWGKHHAQGFDLATDAFAVAGSFDAILLTVKSYDTKEVAAAVADRLADDGLMISLQNGLGNVEAIQECVEPTRVLAGRVIFGAEIVAPAAVRVTVYAEPVLIGAWHRRDRLRLEAAARYWAATFATAGIAAEYCAEVQAALWGKVFYNAALNPLGALLGVHYGALGDDADSRAVMDAVIAEAYAVAQAEGVSLPWATADAYREVFYGRLVPSTFHHRSSMLQDLEHGRRTEVEAINGEVWRRGQAHRLATPANELLTRLLRARTRRGKRRENDA
jgi:2-dehydropantoate 2-reductase